MASGPMYFRCMIVRPSGLAARELPLFRIAWVTYERWNCVLAASRGRVLMIRRLTRRVLESEEWGVMLVVGELFTEGLGYAFVSGKTVRVRELKKK